MKYELGDLNAIILTKTASFIKYYIVILMFILLTLFSIVIFYQYHKYENYFGYIGKEGDYYIGLYLEDNAISKLASNVLLIDNQEFKYDKIDISSEYYIENNNKYRLVKLYGNIDKKYLIINNIVNIKVQKPKTTLLKQIKKGMNLWN